MNFDSANWLAYREANMRFADVVASFVQAGDMIWVQDYHLMLLPMLLRSVISGESAQGEMVRKEMGRVKEGLGEEFVSGMMGMSLGVAQPVGDASHDDDEGVDTLDEVPEEGSGGNRRPVSSANVSPKTTTSATVGGVAGKVREAVSAAGQALGFGESGSELQQQQQQPQSAGSLLPSQPPRSARPAMGRGMSAFQMQEVAAKKKGKEGIRIGFFLHTPFPSSEIYRYAPCIP